MDKKNNIAAIIQARMGSERLPGKVLMDIAGKPMLWHVVNRLKQSKYLNRIIIATTTNKDDEKIVDFCETNNINFYRGSENDVLDRYYKTALYWDVDTIVRITADCPLIDPNVIDKVIISYLKNMDNFDGSSNTIERTYPRGLDTEVISSLGLSKAWNEAKEDYQREHVTIYIYENPLKFKLYSLKNDVDLSYYRWTVDEKKDLKLVKNIYKFLYSEGNIFLTKDILKLLELKPNLKKINKDVEQKKI